MKTLYFHFLFILFCFACQSDQPVESMDVNIVNGPLFKEMKDSGVDFVNKLDLSSLKSTMEFINVYNGGGVGVADINNDGLLDIYLTGNQVDNKLYLNKGNMKFEDITEKAGVSCSNSWSTGVTFGDVNNDGFIDIYVCRSYFDQKVLRSNVLFINNGDLTFSDKSNEYKVGDTNYSMQAAFLDYDKDGFLDLYVGNCAHIARKYRALLEDQHHTKHFLNPTDLTLSDRLYKNIDGKGFREVTKEAGILNYGYMLGISIADYNKDGWQDIYVAVDHGEPDLLYINQGNGTFSNKINESFKHISLSSMGTDAADLNNDELIDIVSLDMLSRDHYSEKTQMASMNVEAFENNVRNGYHYQYMRNMLQLNMGNNKFSEIGQMAGIHKTDWSWSVLAADYDNDGWKDIFITNGYYRTILDKDINKKVKKEFAEKATLKDKYRILDEFPMRLKEQRNNNVLYLNQKNYTFKDASSSEGISQNGFSSGGIYADLDNDGDQDLIVSNIDEPVSILKNTQEKTEGNNYIKISLDNNNKPTLGTKIKVVAGGIKQYYEHTISRGYQSAVEGSIIFGLGKSKVVEELSVEWPNGSMQILKDVKPNKTYELKSKNAKTKLNNNKSEFAFSQLPGVLQPVFKHSENEFDDYEKQVLLPHKMSQLGPFLAKGDLNGDGKEDFFVGGASGQAGSIFLQNADGKWTKSQSFQSDIIHEDMGALFFDIDGDKDLDLYVVSGGNAFKEGDKNYQDRLYTNNGKGSFVKSNMSLPRSSGSVVKAADFDQDGDLDLFVGSKHVPWKYPLEAESYLLVNENGKLTTKQTFKKLGLLSDAVWEDLNQDGKLDLLVVGEWMPITFLINNGKELVNETNKYALDGSNGWWNVIEPIDVDGDGDKDFVIGNLGLNYKYKADKEKPFVVYSGDLDKNGKYDIVLGQYYDNTLCPVRGRQCSSEQIPTIAEEFKSYDEFGKADLKTVYKESLDDANRNEVNNFASSILINNGSNSFKLLPLPNEAQFSTVNAIESLDLNEDGNTDILLAGNLYVSEVETGRADAGTGLILLGNGKGDFEPILSSRSGLYIDKDVKDLMVLNADQKKILLVANNNDQLQSFKINGSNLK